MYNNGIVRAYHGLRALQTKVDTIANNIANIEVHGYKSKETVFGEMLYQQINNQPSGETAAEQGRSTPEMVRLGSGVLVAGNPTQFTQGARKDTGNPTDIMIEGEGFFRVVRDLDNNGALEEAEYRYTRNGAFHLSPIGDENYLVTANGEFVLNEDDEPIAFEAGSSFQVQPNGMIIATNLEGEETELGRIGVFNFPNVQMLIRDGNGNWLLHPEADPGENESVAAADHTYGIVQGALEGSNVDLTQQMTDLIAAQRTMSMMSRALTMSDQMMGMANELIRR